jgi:hypothetical protein
MKTIYVGNLPFTASEDQVRQLFEQYGKVQSVKLITDRETGSRVASGSSRWMTGKPMQQSQGSTASNSAAEACASTRPASDRTAVRRDTGPESPSAVRATVGAPCTCILHIRRRPTGTGRL